MKKIITFIFTFLITTLLLTSCGEISKQVAKESLNGRYNGKATYHFNFSQLNIGIDNQEISTDCFAIVFADTKNPSIVVTTLPDKVSTNLKMMGFKLLSNGASFNIAEQTIYDKETPIKIQGNSIMTDTDGNKSDGFINDQNEMSFSYIGVFEINQNGVKYNLYYIANYELTKIPD